MPIPSAEPPPGPRRPATTTAVRPPTTYRGGEVPVAGRRWRQLHQPVLPLRPLRDRHRGRLRLEGPRRRRPAPSPSPAGRTTAAATRSGSPTAPTCTRRTTTCRRSRSGSASTSSRGQQVGRVGQIGQRDRPALPLRGLGRPGLGRRAPRQPARTTCSASARAGRRRRGVALPAPSWARSPVLGRRPRHRPAPDPRFPAWLHG